jgi:hypothetical protein
VNRAVARFILRSRGAGAKGCAPACPAVHLTVSSRRGTACRARCTRFGARQLLRARRNEFRCPRIFGQVVRVLYHVRPFAQLYSHRLCITVKRKLKCEITPTFANFGLLGDLSKGSSKHTSQRGDCPERERVEPRRLSHTARSRSASGGAPITNPDSPITDPRFSNRSSPIIRNPLKFLATNEKTFSKRWFFRLFGASTASRKSNPACALLYSRSGGRASGTPVG